MKTARTIPSKRSRRTLLLAILVGAAGCTTSDNNQGSQGTDSGVADGPAQAARDAQLNTGDGNPAYSSPADGAAPDAVSAGKETAQELPTVDAAVPDGASVAKDAVQALPSADGAAPDVVSVGKDAAQESSLADGAALDAVSVGNDAAPDWPEAGVAHECRLNADGTCSAVTSNTACTPVIGHRYDESAGCYFVNATTLGCCATAPGEFCGLPTATGCYQVATDGGTVAYWTPALATAAVTIPGGQACVQTTYAKIPSASLCRATSPDAAAPPDAATPDAHVPVSLPLCTTDDDCCISVDTCFGIATLGGKAGWGPVPGTHAAGDICPPCAAPAVQVQCKGGFCIGTKLGTFPPVGMEKLAVSHCGYIAPPDAGAAHAVSPHAVVDGGVSYKTSWSCGEY